jgi:phenylacetate-CoA ligase
MNLEHLYKISPTFVQTLMLNGKAFELYIERYGKKFDLLYEEFKRNEFLSSEEIREYQVYRLKKLVAHAYGTVPYYHDVFNQHGIKPTDINGLEDLHKIPILTKQDIKKNFGQLISTAVNRNKLKHGHTSGTTGSPLDLLYDVETCVVHHVADWRQKSWAGLRRGDAYASIQGRVICPTEQEKPPFWRKNYINNQLFLSSFHLKKENLPYYFDKLSKDGIQYIEGYPSTVYTLAAFLMATGQTFPIKAILTSSETLFDFQREAIEKAFLCKVFDFYGMAERTVYASECDHHQGHHLNLDYGITEFVNDAGEILGAGQHGRIVATSLHNFAFPLIRYQTNDSCSLKDELCGCGRVFPLMDDVATKDEAIISLPDGRWISPSVLTHPFKPMDNIVESQIIQESLHNIRILIVKNELYSNEDERIFLNSFIDRVGLEVEISIEYVDQIERTKNGKYKWVISKIKPEFL